MRVITLEHQLAWAEVCLKKMKDNNRPEDEISLQESICGTLIDRIREKVTNQ